MKCNTHIEGLAYIFRKTVNIVKIVPWNTYIWLFCILFKDYKLRWNDEYVDD